MRPDPRKYLWDALHAAELVQDFARGQSFADYQSDAKLRSAVERQFEIIGEALNQLSKVDPEAASRVSGLGPDRGFSKHPDPWLCNRGRCLGLAGPRGQAARRAASSQ